MEKLLIAILFLLYNLVSLSQSYSITGVHAGVNNGTGARPFRQNINTLKKSGPAWDLYVLSLQRLMGMNQDDTFSYYKISGIHGYPADTPWDGVIGTAGGIGYCEHGSVLFPVWHRPYLALFERVWEFAQEIAAEYPSYQQAEYKAAAVSLRIPYWDWSLDSSLPDVTSRPQISINAPAGKMIIENPLYAYTFHPLKPEDLPFLSQYPTSVREPNQETLQSQDNLVNQGLLDTASYWHDNTYLLFSSISDWNTFASSIESLHGGIHDYVGGPTSPNNGHMTFLWYSAFDPIFWLHHTQIDRLVAIWQAIHPYAYIEPQASTTTTYYESAGTIQNETYPLVPFRRNIMGEFHTGQTVRRLKRFGYSYPELVYWSEIGSNVWTLQKEVISLVNTMYNPKYGNDGQDLDKGDSKDDIHLDWSLDTNWEWKFNLTINRTAIIAPAALSFFFNGHASLTDDPVSLDNRSSLIGTQILLQPRTGGTIPTPFSSNSANVPLTRVLFRLGSLEPDQVIPWIKNKIIWKSIRIPSHQALPADAASINIRKTSSNIPSGAVTIDLVARKVTHSTDKTAFPQYGSWIVYGSGNLAGDEGIIDLR